MRSPLRLLSLVAVAACGGTPATTPDMTDPNALTTGVVVSPAGCPFMVKTPSETTAPVADSDAKGAAPDPVALHLSFTGDPSTSVSVVWRTDMATLGTRVEYGESKAYG